MYLFSECVTVVPEPYPGVLINENNIETKLAFLLIDSYSCSTEVNYCD